MEVWKYIIFILSALGLFLFGYFLMAKLDKFLSENRRAIEKENEKREPSCIMLTEELSDEEFVEEVKRFRKTHEGTRIFIYDSTDTELSGHIEYHTKHKQ